MSTKVKRYGWKRTDSMGVVHKLEFATKAQRDSAVIGHDDTKYSVLRTLAKPKGRPLWWAIRQLQEGRAVVDADGDTWYPTGVKHLDRSLFSLLQSVGCDGVSGTDDYAQSWTLAGQP